MEPPSSSSSQPAAPPSTDAPPPQQPPQQPPPQSQSQSQSQSQPSSSSSLPPSSSSSTSSLPIPIPIPIPIPTPNPNPNPNPNSANTLPTLPQSSQQFSRPWSQPQTQPSQFSHFPTPQYQPQPALPSSAPSSAPPIQRGPIAIGVPAAASASASPSPTPQPAAAGSNQTASFSTGFVGAQYAGIPRGGPDPNVAAAPPSSAPARPSMHGMPNLGMMSSQIRPGAVAPSAVHQQRPVQAASGIRPQNAPNNMPPVPQNFQGHGILRGSSVGGPSSATPSSSSQSQASGHQPWLSTAPHGRPPIPSQPFRQQANSQTVQQQRPPHVPQQSPQAQAMHTASQPQQSSSSSQPSNQSPQDNNNNNNNNNNNPGQQLPPSRVPPQPSVNQPGTRIQGMATQRPPSPAVVAQPSVAQPSSADQPGGGDILETCNRILSKRNIQELVNQIDPSEKLDPEVEDVLVDIAEDFIESVTTFGCSLAKHRKSNTLEAKDILLHIERAWNMTLPGFSGDEIKTFKKPVINDVHKERLAVVKKSIAAGETVNSKSSGGPGGANAKGSLVKSNPNAAG